MSTKAENTTPERNLLGESLYIVSKYFKVRLLVSLIVCVACYLVMWLLLDLKWRIPVSMVVGLFNLVPYVGPVAAMIIAAVVAVLQDPMDALWITVTLFSLQILDAILLSPLLLGKSLGLHPIIVFTAIFIGGSIFGIIGMVVAAPVAAIAVMIARRIQNNLRKRQMERNG